MKTIKRRILTTMLAMLLTIVSIAAFGFGKRVNTASALSEDYHGEPDTIYYFFDYYPTTSYSELIAEMPEIVDNQINVVYDRNIVDELGFYNLIDTGHFNGFGKNCDVIIDIKTFVPNETVLETLFSQIKGQHSGADACKTTFITIADKNSFINSQFTQYVDKLIYTNYSKLNRFISESVNQIAKLWGDFDDLQNLCILIDGNTIIKKNGDTIIETAPFLDKFIEELLTKFGYASLDELYEAKNIAVLVNTSCNNYTRISESSYSRVIYSGMGEIFHDYSNVYTVGFWRLNDYFSEMLRNGQQGYGADNVSAFLLECDPVMYSDNGLVCTIVGCGGGDGVTDDANEELMGAIREWLNSII